jgi:hypothetical protein
MNHREVMTARAKKARHKFLELPEGLQDEIVARLDGNSLTIEAAEDLCREAGTPIGKSSIGRYYEALRRERALQIRRERLEQNIAALISVDPDETAKLYLKLAIDLGAEAIMAAGGDVEALKNACIAASSAVHAVADLTRARTGEQKVKADLRKLDGMAEKAEQAGKHKRELDPGTLRKIREQVYGLV